MVKTEIEYKNIKVGAVYEYPSTVEEGLVQIHSKNLIKLAMWLIDNEGDIAYEMRDYGELKGVFYDVLDREPLRGNLK